MYLSYFFSKLYIYTMTCYIQALSGGALTGFSLAPSYTIQRAVFISPLRIN